jgi:hypothetical protein
MPAEGFTGAYDYACPVTTGDWITFSACGASPLNPMSGVVAPIDGMPGSYELPQGWPLGSSLLVQELLCISASGEFLANNSARPYG